MIPMRGMGVPAYKIGWEVALLGGEGVNASEIGWDNMRTAAEQSAGDCIPMQSLGTRESY